MDQPSKPASPPRRWGRPQTRIIKLDATPEEAAWALFSAVKPPDPGIRASIRKTPAALVAVYNERRRQRPGAFVSRGTTG